MYLEWLTVVAGINMHFWVWLDDYASSAALIVFDLVAFCSQFDVPYWNAYVVYTLNCASFYVQLDVFPTQCTNPQLRMLILARSVESSIRTSPDA